jgi:dynactin 1
MLNMNFRIQAQFDHLAETYFEGFDFDLAERELGYAVSFELDLDMFSASVALTKTCVATIMEDKGAVSLLHSLIYTHHGKDVDLDLGGYDVEEELLGPLQKLLDQCKSAKVLSKCVSFSQEFARESVLMYLVTGN